MPREYVALSLPAMRWLTPLVALLALAVDARVASTSYASRFARWQWLLRLLGHRLPAGFSVRVYLGGLALSPTQGKVDETMRSAPLLPHGVPLGHSLTAFFAGRWSDVIGVATLVGAASGSRQSVLFAAVAAIGIQGLVFGAFVQTVAPQIGLLTCVAIFSSAALFGAASMIPGGLGAKEAALGACERAS